MTTKQCAEGSRLEGLMLQAIQNRADARQSSHPSEQADAAATKAAEDFQSHRQNCDECEIPVPNPS